MQAIQTEPYRPYRPGMSRGPGPTGQQPTRAVTAAGRGAGTASVLRVEAGLRPGSARKAGLCRASGNGRVRTQDLGIPFRALNHCVPKDLAIGKIRARKWQKYRLCVTPFTPNLKRQSGSRSEIQVSGSTSQVQHTEGIIKLQCCFESRDQPWT
jgi:hypothetical protein